MPPRPRTVLFVDDDPAVLRALTASLHGCPYRVLAVISGDEALRVLGRERVGVLVADHQMPGMTGLELLAMALRRYPGTARVLLTGQVSLTLTLRAINESQVCHILTKPWSRDDLLAALEAALRYGEARSAFQSAIPEATHEGADPSRSAARWSRPPTSPPVALHHLSPREAEVVALLGRGDRVEQIASAMFLSRHTVRNHLKAIFRKVGVHSQGELVALMRRAKGRDRST